MKIIVTLSALVLIVSLWGCAHKSSGPEASVTGPCSGMTELTGQGSTRNPTATTNCADHAKNIAP